MHALRGSAGLAGERELAAALERIDRRIREGEEAAWEEMTRLVSTALERLPAGESAVVGTWPGPPDSLRFRSIDPGVEDQYAIEVRDRLARIDEALALSEDPVETALTVYRHIHTMKGAASSVGDEPMSWFCHGLEERIRGADSVASSLASLQEVARWRSMLGLLLDEPETALARLGGVRPSTVPLRASEPVKAGIEDGAATIRIPAADVDRLLERLDGFERARERIASRAQRGGEAASKVRDMRAALVAALRLIGPPRLWGPPAAALEGAEGIAGKLAILADELDTASGRLRATEQGMREGVVEAKRQLLAMRQTTVGRIFARLTTAIESEARRTGRAVIVRTRGSEETIDRRLAEQLLEPCLQLVRNAVAHGIEPPDVRAVAGKGASGTISLDARKVGSRLRVTIMDDGAGVDVKGVRDRAVNAGLVTPAIADAADDDTLLSLLFLPGFSTRESSDLLAGRGIGLDIARVWIQRVGGAIRLSNRMGEGLSAQIDVPMETGLLTILWVRAGVDEFAVPVANVRCVRKNDSPEATSIPHLLACLDVGATRHAQYGLDLGAPTDELSERPAWVGVDGIGATEELLVRPLGALVTALGPFAGAIVREGGLRLALDPWALAPRARALAAAQAAPSKALAYLKESRDTPSDR